MVHGLDITVALGIGRQVPAERLRLLLVAYGRKLPPGRLHDSARDRYIAA